MSFTGAFLHLVGLAKIELPSTTLRLCDGGFAYYGGEKYTARHADFGVIAALEPIDELTGDMAPGGRITFLPASATAAATLSSPEYQFSRMRFWIGEIGSDGKTVSNAELLADVLIDTTTLRLPRGGRALDIDFISRAEKLFLVNEGNVLSTRFHDTVWSGEKGFDNANGLQRNVAWGTEAPPRGVSSGSGFGGGVGGGSFQVGE